jgi:phage-related protein
MRISLDGLEFKSSGDMVLKSSVKGLGAPTIRTASSEFSGRDGGFLSSQFYDMREIVLDLMLLGSNCQTQAENICQLEAKTGIRQSYPLVITMATGTQYTTEVYVINVESEIESERYMEVQLTLMAPDPFFYILTGGDDAGWIEQTIEEIASGGYETPYILPVVWSPSSQPTIVTNDTDMPIYPQIILEGKYTNPEIENLTTGQTIGVNITTAPGDKLVIDMKNRTITLNGGSVLPSKVGDWWGLASGDNNIVLTTGSGTDTKTGVIRYRPAYTSVYGGVCS